MSTIRAGVESGPMENSSIDDVPAIFAILRYLFNKNMQDSIFLGLVGIGGTAYLSYQIGKYYADKWIKQSHLDEFDKLLIVRVDSFDVPGRGSTFAKISYEQTTVIFQNNKLYVYDAYMPRTIGFEDSSTVYESIATDEALVLDLRKLTRQPLLVTSEETMESFFYKNRNITTTYKIIIKLDQETTQPTLLKIVNLLIHRGILALG